MEPEQQGAANGGKELPVTGNPVVDTATKIFAWLGECVEWLLPRPRPVAPSDPAKMTDEQLHHAIHDVGARLLNGLAPIVQKSFVHNGSTELRSRVPSSGT